MYERMYVPFRAKLNLAANLLQKRTGRKNIA